MSSMVLKPKLLLDCSLSMGIKKLKERAMPRQFCLGIFWFRFAAIAFRKRSMFSNDTHNSFTLCSVYLDLEFISSPAKLWKAQADNRLHVGKAHFQYAICLNALLCDTSFVSVL